MTKKIGITGQNGFIGSHLYNYVGLEPEKFERIVFAKDFFENSDPLDEFVKNCDVIVHLAAMNRSSDPEQIYDTNLDLVQKLVASLKRTGSEAHVIFSSSSQEQSDNLYGKSKKLGRELLAEWAAEHNGKFTGIVIPNVFGPFGKPYYNSFIATFCHQLTHNEVPKIDVDGEVYLIYVGDVIHEIISIADQTTLSERLVIAPTHKIRVSEVLSKLETFKDQYLTTWQIPTLTNAFDYHLFNTFRSYIEYSDLFPVKLTQHTDARGAFVEVIRLGIGGQCSFSTTVPGVTRGNHFHTRKIERFAVIKGQARIQLRKIDSEEVMNFDLNGNEPAFVDMPIWYTHNITNTGEDELYTIFWINEAYNPEDADTYFVEV